MSASESTTDCHEATVDVFRRSVIDKLGVSAAFDGISPLMAPIENDDRDLVASLIDSKANQRRVSSDSLSALRYAVRHGSVSVAELLISRGSSVSTHDIIEAASQGHEALVNVLVSRYNQENARSLLHLLPKLLQPHTNPKHAVAVDILVAECATQINQSSMDGQTPILRAISASEPYIISAFIKAGAHFPKRHESTVSLQLLRHGYNDAAETLLLKYPRKIAFMVDSQGSTALHLAGTAHLVELLLEACCDPNAEDCTERTPLFYAKNAEIAKTLLDARANIEHRDCFSCTPLMCVEREDVATTLLQRKAAIHIGANGKDQTLLMMAAKWNNLKLLKKLLKMPTANKFIDVFDGELCTALAHAAKQGSVEAVKALLDAGADVRVKGCDGNTPLHVATDCEIIRLLAASGADINIPDNHGFHPLYYRCADGDTDAVKLLLSFGAKVNIERDWGLTTLLYTMEQNHLDTLNVLLDHLPHLKSVPDNLNPIPVFIAAMCSHSRSASAFITAWGRVNKRSECGKTALMDCVEVDIAQQLIRLGVCVDAVDNTCRTALHHACAEGRTEMVSFLLKNGADVFAQDSTGKTALYLACEKNRLGAVVAVISAEYSSMEWINACCNNNSSTALHIAVQESFGDIVACLLTAGAKQTLNGDGKSPLHLAVRSSLIVRLLLEAGAKDVKDRNGYTALMRVCMSDDWDAVSLRVAKMLSDPKYRHSCDVNAMNSGETALSLARKHYHFDIFSALLLSPLLDIDQRVGENGRTLLHIVGTTHWTQQMEGLLAAGADLYSTDIYGNIPLTNVDDLDMMKLLIEAAPKTVYYRHNHGRTMLMSFCPLFDPDLVEQFFLLCSERLLAIDVNAIDDSGDTALDIAMMAPHCRVISLLLDNRARVMGTGWQDTTVLMKPFLDRDDPTVKDHYRHIPKPTEEFMAECGEQLENDRDEDTQQCIEMVISQLQREIYSMTERTTSGAGSGAGAVRRREGVWEPTAKRRRM